MAKSGETKEKRTMRVHDACHNGNLLEKCLTVVHQAVTASSCALAASSSPANCS